ncbi:peptide-methionine (S)-S-oxide reductase MsrA [Pectinatus cerevisiiphilus]|uniref:Peptide methionine sulfoxide reductase MsrA n=1 Tax=Pectinatus cerevisiiphilus TaxID=86956 RepID=A0A4R3K1W1_9FIRM|nr:peptide-methionine (S)-S-oxide reductase MsrA [Pectinatus cerevisiiphilus]TCS75958.1 peptide-methionine (S)-S-oxide reductase [Pectinatus cerevisiiphilus]
MGKDVNYTEEPNSEIYLAGGCFWGLQAYLDKLKGVICTEVGYANGYTEMPSYEEVCSNMTGHAETVYVKYDSNIISLAKLLQYFFKVIDPTAYEHQGNDYGSQYRTGIYYKNTCDKKIIEQVTTKVKQQYTADIVTEILPIKCYYSAEAYHQKYLEKNPSGYCHINLKSLQNDPMAKE